MAWFVIYLAACIPKVLTNIFAEWVFDDTDNKFDVWVLLGFQSLYQCLTVCLLFWIDVVPSFGYSRDMLQWSEFMKDGLRCVFAPGSLNFTAPVNATEMYNYNHCYNSGLFGFLFLTAYVLSYVCGAYVFRDSSANFAGIVTSIGSPIIIFIWFSIPVIEKWQCGADASEDVTTMILSFFSLGPMIGGAVLFRWGEQKVEKGDQDDGSVYEVSLKLS